jgi:hypothetical protein
LAVFELLSDPRHRLRAREVADDITGLPPVDDAVGALRALAAHGPVVTP